MSAWKPGAVVNVGHMLAFYTDGNEGPMFTFADGSRARADVVPADPARPLVVIDPEDAEQVERLIANYVREGSALGYKMPANQHDDRAEAMQAALREFANPKPPKPDEPTGLGAVVQDDDGVLWVRYTADTERAAWRRDDPLTASQPWERVNAIEVLSEGVIA